MHSTLSRITTLILDVLAPRRCLCCGAYGTWLCDPCRNGIVHNNIQQICYHCKKTPTPYGNLCAHCRGATPLRSMLIATTYNSSNHHLLAKVIHHYKYTFIRELSHPLGHILAQRIAATPLPLPDIIIPVPLHPRRLRWRGFNQSHDLARVIAPQIAPPLSVPIIITALTRTRYTSPQAHTTLRSERIHNLKNAFTVTNQDAVTGKHILLVDDVATTGATLIECARTLLNAGAVSIDAVVISRGI